MKRSSELRRKAWMKHGTKPLAKQNAERAKKRAVQRRKKGAAARRSEGYRLAMERAGGRCEYRVPAFVRDPFGMGEWEYTRRCDETEGLEAHHDTYARYGGAELPEDFRILCKAHHALVETQDHPTRRRSA